MTDTEQQPTIPSKELPSFKSNESLPYIKVDKLRPLFVDGLESPEYPNEAPVQEIEVKKIVAGSSLESWGDITGIDKEKLAAIHVDVVSGKKVDQHPIIVYDYGGLYVTIDGQKRTMVAKLRGIETIKARVQKVQPTILKFGVIDEVWHDVLQRRKNQSYYPILNN